LLILPHSYLDPQILFTLHAQILEVSKVISESFYSNLFNLTSRTNASISQPQLEFSLVSTCKGYARYARCSNRVRFEYAWG